MTRLIVVQGPLQLMNVLSVLRFQQKTGEYIHCKDHLLIDELGNSKMLEVCRQIACVWDFETIQVLDYHIHEVVSQDLQSAFDLLKTCLSLPNVDVIYTCRNWQFINEGVLRAYPQARKICYGDGLGILDLNNTVYGSPLTSEGFTQVDEAYLLVPSALEKCTLEICPITIVPFDNFVSIVYDSAQTIPGLPEFCHNFIATHARPLTWITTANWSETFQYMNISLEIHEYLSCILPITNLGEILIIKGHPRQTLNQSGLLVNELLVNGRNAFELPEYTEVPLELFLPYLCIERAITLISSVGVSLAYFCQSEIWVGIGEDSINRFVPTNQKKYYFQSERLLASMVRQGYIRQFEPIWYRAEDWPGKLHRGPLHLFPQKLAEKLCHNELGLESQTQTAWQIAERIISAKVADRNKVIQSLTTQVAEKEQVVESLTAQAAEREQVVQTLTAKMVEIRSSKAWKIALLFRQLRVILTPPNSRRTQILSSLVRMVGYPIKKVRKNFSSQKEITLIKSSDLFDIDWYLEHNPDVTQAGVDPLRHYLQFGGFEGRDPGPNFSSKSYLERNPDVQAAGLNPLVHYLRWGKIEGRKIN